LEHSDVASLKASKDTVCEEIQNALNVISNASQGIQNMPALSEPQAATLGSALDELEVSRKANVIWYLNKIVNRSGFSDPCVGV
jgi:hypothetical protein